MKPELDPPVLGEPLIWKCAWCGRNWGPDYFSARTCCRGVIARWLATGLLVGLVAWLVLLAWRPI